MNDERNCQCSKAIQPQETLLLDAMTGQGKCSAFNDILI
jgi:hypothetical protein